MSKISAYAELTSVAAGDYLLVIDVSDTSMGSGGTDKKITVANLTALTTQLDSSAADIQPPGTVSAGTSALASRADHVHASGAISPADTGAISWTDDPYSAGGSGGLLTAGKLSLCMFWIRKTAVLSTIAVNVTTAGATLAPTQCFAGIYSTAGTLMGQTGDQSAVWNAPGNAAMAITSPFSAAPGTYWAALLANGTTMPNFRGVGGSPALVNSNLTAAQSRVGFYGTGQTALPASITPASITQAGAGMYTVVIY